MKKIVSLFVFIAALIWTWNVIHSEGAISFETHAGIQYNFAQLIKDTVMKKRPNSQNIEILNIWTEPMSDNKVKAVFSYKYSEKDSTGSLTTQQIEGESVLHRDPSAQANEDRWVVQQVKTTSDSITFDEGMIIGPGSKDEPAASNDSGAAEVLPEQGLEPAHSEGH